FHMAQQVVSAAQLVPRYHTIGRCNNYVVLQSISCSLECKIVGKILLDHLLSSALTATADVPVVYLQQFWRTVSKVPDTEDTIKFMLDTKEFTYTVDMFRVTLHLPVETSKNPFVALVNIQTIKVFMNKVGYQGVVDKVSAFYMKNLAQPWQTMFKVFNRFLTTRTSGHDQTKINILQLFHVVINQKNVDYAALVCVYTTGNLLVQGMLIPNEFLTEEIRTTDDFKEYEMVFVRVDVLMNQPKLIVSTQGMHRSTPRAHRTPTVSTASPQGKNRKQIVRESSSPQKSLKITIRQKQAIEGENDDVDSEDSLDTRTEEMQTPTSTPPRSPRTILSSNKNITRELTDIVSLPTTTTSKTSHSKRRISSKYSHLPVLHEIVPQLAERATDDLIENNLKPSIAATIIEDAFQSVVPDLVSQEFNAQAPKIIEELFKNYVQSNVIQVYPTTTTSTKTTSSADLQQQLYFKMKRSLQDQVNGPVLDDDIHSKRHDDHQEDDAPPEGEKRVK
ncbi:hypothetical protein Tco_0323373, partial [Tanacetum coccineum]